MGCVMELRLEDKQELVKFLRAFGTAYLQALNNGYVSDPVLLELAQKVVNSIEQEKQRQQQIEQVRHDQWVKAQRAKGGKITSSKRRTETTDKIHQACKELASEGVKITIDTVAERAGIHRSSVHRYYDTLMEYTDSQ